MKVKDLAVGIRLKCIKASGDGCGAVNVYRGQVVTVTEIMPKGDSGKGLVEIRKPDGQTGWLYFYELDRFMPVEPSDVGMSDFTKKLDKALGHSRCHECGTELAQEPTFAYPSTCQECGTVNKAEPEPHI